MTAERWAEVDGYPRYQVSDQGRVRLAHGKITFGIDTGHGYRKVLLGAGNPRYVHRLVAEAFIPNEENLPEVNHIDANRSNNAVANLEWVTRLGNARHAVKLGRYVGPGIKGEDRHASRLTDERVREIYDRYARGGVTQAQLSAEFGVVQSQIARIVSGEGWRHVTGGTPIGPGKGHAPRHRTGQPRQGRRARRARMGTQANRSRAWLFPLGSTIRDQDDGEDHRMTGRD